MKHYSLFVSIVLTLMLLSIGGICYAQNMSNMSNKSEMSDTTKIHNLDEVVVTTNTKTKQSRATAPLQILTGEALEGLNAIQVADAVKHFSGVMVKDYGGIGGLKTMSVRSLGASHTAVSYDGIAVNDAQNGQIDIRRFSLDNVDMV